MMGWAKQAAAVFGIWALCLTTGCGTFFVYPGNGGSGSSGSGDYVYVANQTTQTVAGYSVGTAALTTISGLPSSLGFAPTAVAVNPANSILFVASNSGIYTYSISSGGVLNTLSSGVTSGLTDVVSMDVSPDGQWLFAVDGIAVNTASGAYAVTVYQFAINSSTGALTLESGLPYSVNGQTSTNPVPSAIKVASVSSGVYVFVAMGTAGMLEIPFNTSTGVQSAASQYGEPTGSSIYLADDALAVYASGSILYVTRSNSTSAGEIVGFSIGSNGALTSLGQLPTGAKPVSVAVNKAGTDVYVANQIDGTISQYSAASNGALTALTTPTYSSGLGATPAALAVDNSGNYLLAVSSGGNPDLSMYGFSSGQLSFSTSTQTGTNSSGEGAIAIATTH